MAWLEANQKKSAAPSVLIPTKVHSGEMSMAKDRMWEALCLQPGKDGEKNEERFSGIPVKRLKWRGTHTALAEDPS